jgi:MFS superfamily sulfate permease-like transporter
MKILPYCMINFTTKFLLPVSSYMLVLGKLKAVDVNQELIALGASQFLAAFFHSMPVTGSISTSCVNAVSGVKTPLGGLWAGWFFLPTKQYSVTQWRKLCSNSEKLTLFDKWV